MVVWTLRWELHFTGFITHLTGKTPQRREFEYPRVLAKTDPHFKIIQEFSLKYKEHAAIEREARDKQLPSESDDEEVCENFIWEKTLDQTVQLQL